MRTLARNILSGALAAAVAWPVAARAETGSRPADRYDVITDKKPFKELEIPDPPPPPGPPPKPAAPSDSFGKDFELRAFIEDSDGLRVGFLDKKTNKTFFLPLGGSIGELELISADYTREEAVLRKDTETCMFNMMKNPKKKDEGKTAGPMPFPQPGPALGPAMPVAPTADARPSFRGKTIEEFMREHPDLVKQSPSPIRIPDGGMRNFGRGMTIEQFMKEHPEAMKQFPSPIQPTDPSQGRGESIERFLRQNQGAVQYMQPPIPIQTPAVGTEAQPAAQPPQPIPIQ